MGLFDSYGSHTTTKVDPNKEKELGKERALIDESVQAGRDRTGLYEDAAKQYEQYMRQGMQSAAQLTPRMLQGASSFNAPGGASIVAAEAVAPSIAAAQSQLGMTGTDKILGAGVGGKESQIGASEYAMSAMPHVVKQKKVLGYMDIYGDARNTMDDDEARDFVFSMLQDELDPEVIETVGAMIRAAG